MMKVMCILAALSLAALPALAQAPNGVHVMLPGSGANYVQSTATSGTLTSRGITCTWTTSDYSATITFSGTYATEWISPNFNCYWFSTPDNLPMSIHVVSTTAGEYDFEAPFNTGSWDTSLNQNNLVGNFDFGYHFPACSRMDINVNPDIEGAPYDISVTMDWGPGTGVGESTFGALKALYR